MTAFASLTLSHLTAALRDLSCSSDERIRQRRLVALPGEGGGDVAQAARSKPSSVGSDQTARPSEIHIVRTVHGRDPLGARYTVLVGGRYYEVNKYLLASIKAGIPPQQLDLDPVEEDDDERLPIPADG